MPALSALQTAATMQRSDFTWDPAHTRLSHLMRCCRGTSPLNLLNWQTDIDLGMSYRNGYGMVHPTFSRHLIFRILRVSSSQQRAFGWRKTRQCRQSGAIKTGRATLQPPAGVVELLNVLVCSCLQGHNRFATCTTSDRFKSLMTDLINDCRRTMASSRRCSTVRARSTAYKYSHKRLY